MIKLIIAGDFCPRHRSLGIIESRNFKPFEDICSIIKEADYSIVNLESPIIRGRALPINKQGPNLYTTPNALNFIKYLGFNAITLANNHFYDYGEKGVYDTLSISRELSIDTVGGGINFDDAKKILYKSIKSKTIAFINVCEHEFSISTNNHGGSNPLNTISNYYDVIEAKRNSDYVIIIVHGGNEHFQLPTPRMQDLYRFFIDIGADAVINHHQHCFSGYETYNGKPIIYGIGNFYFDHKKKRNNIWNEGFLLNIIIDESIKISLIPYIQCNEDPFIHLLSDKKLKRFFERIEALNNIIGNRNLLEKEYELFCLKKKRLYMSVLEPYPTKFLKYLYRKKLLPSLLDRYTKLFINNFIICESHIDIIKKILQDED